MSRRKNLSGRHAGTVFIGTLLSIALLLLLSNLLGNGFTSGDEGFTAFARVKAGGFWKAAYNMATSQGRFYQLFVYPFAQLPYLFDSLAVVNACRFLSSGLVFVAFCFFCFELWGIEIAFLSTALVIGLLQTVGGGYNPFHGLPFWFNTGGMILLLSLALYARAVRNGRSLLFSSTLAFVSLLYYEPFVLFLLAYPLVFEFSRAATKPDQEKIGNRLAHFIRANHWLIFFSGLYMVLYVGFRFIFPSKYAGTRFSLAPVDEMARTVWNFSLGGINTRFELPGLDAIDPRALVLTALVCVCLGLTLLKITGKATGRCHPRYGLAALLVLPFIFLPNLLFGFTERYRGWAKQEPYYLGSFYSGFAICLALALFLAWLFSTMQRQRHRQYLLCLLLLLVSLFVYRNQVHANRFYDESRLQSAKWVLAKNMGEKLATKHLDMHTICTETLISGKDAYDYWSFYISEHANRKISLRYAKSSDEGCDSFLTYRNWGGSSYFNVVGTEGNLLERINP